jgi:hypothetical protein
MILKAILRLRLPGLCILFFTAILLALIRYSYRAKELLTCWLFFCSFFGVLALTSLGIALLCFAGQFLLRRPLAPSSPVIAPDSDPCLLIEGAPLSEDNVRN